jgi:uncharacterized protein (TIGR00255 family)
VKGMTAFGKAKQQDDKFQISVEISSVNRRHTELSVKLPPGYQELESAIRKELLEKINRGQVTVSVDITPCDAAAMIPTINWPWIGAQATLAQEIGKRVGANISLEKIALELWRLSATQKQEKDCTAVLPLLLKALQQSLEAFDAQKIAEGISVEKDFVERVALLRSYAEKVAEQTKSQVENIRQRITTLLKDFVSKELTTDERVMREVVLQADKADISEELVRIRHHLDHFEDVIMQKKPVGKLLEFILQELLREFNTLGAKTSISQVSTCVVLAKTELEKLREQVQNVE